MQILLVDDEPSLLSLLSQFLTRHGHTVRTAATCAEGLAALAGTLDAAIIDLTLPDGSGEEIAKACGERHPAAKIVIVTGYAYTSPWTVLQKPFPPRELLNILR